MNVLEFSTASDLEDADNLIHYFRYENIKQYLTACYNPQHLQEMDIAKGFIFVE